MTVLVVEDFAIYRSLLLQVCLVAGGASRVFEAADLATARATLAAEQVDLVLLDLDLPDGSGFDLVDDQLKRQERPKIVVVSAHCEDYTMLRVERLGLEGFVDKRNGGVAMLREALATLKAGRRYHSPYLLERKQAMRDDPACFTKILSDWEVEILSLIGRVLTDAEIGNQLGLRASTIQMHRSQIMRKLEITGTPKLIHFALEKGIASWPQPVQPRRLRRVRCSQKPMIPPSLAPDARRIQRIAIVEDEPLFCEVLRQLIEKSTNVCLAAALGNGREAARYLKSERPDAVVLDLGLPDLDGFSLIKETRKHSPKTRFLVVTANSDDYTLFRLSRARVQGFVDKRSDDLACLQIAIKRFAEGAAYFSTSYQDATRRREQMVGLNAARLTEREREVLMLVGLGLSNREIGQRLQISAETAERHRNNLFLKLDIRRTPKLMELANMAGFTRIPPGGRGPPVYS